jgi:hypothetical protein
MDHSKGPADALAAGERHTADNLVVASVELFDHIVGTLAVDLAADHTVNSC